MIITRCPLRVSFFGGGTDLKDFFDNEPGIVLSTSIKKYIYLSIHEYFYSKILLKYSKTEEVDFPENISHPIFREVLSEYKVNNVDISSFADIPAGTGLGSSSAFTNALLCSVMEYKKKPYTAYEIARKSASIEIERLNEPIGYQDQYGSAIGGLKLLIFHDVNNIEVRPINITYDLLYNFENSMFLVFTGKTRNAGDVLKDQKSNTSQANTKVFNNLQVLKNQALLGYELLNKRKFDDFGLLLNEAWNLKKTLSANISNDNIDSIYDEGIKSGSLGGKLLGAGSGGFILFYVPKKNISIFKDKMKHYSLINLEMDFEGVKKIYSI